MLHDKLIAAGKWMTRTDRMPRAYHALSIAFAALVTGSRTIPLGDNGTLLHDLAARAGRGPGARAGGPGGTGDADWTVPRRVTDR
ncbi:MAG TPA: hypothetical protein VNR70_09710 [Steroidobacteraceae bacterium]|nr:hypothetical protein [Steroidobacteraceae bacterium]